MDWSDKKKWWLDILKSAIVFSIGAFITVSGLQVLEEKRLKNRFKLQTLFLQRSTIISTFKDNITRYLSYASDAISGDPDAYESYTGKSYEEFLESTSSVKFYFEPNSIDTCNSAETVPTLKEILRLNIALLNTNNTMHNYFKNYNETHLASDLAIFKKAREDCKAIRDSMMINYKYMLNHY